MNVRASRDQHLANRGGGFNSSAAPTRRRRPAAAASRASGGGATAAATAELQEVVDLHLAGDLAAAEAGYERFLRRHQQYPVAYSNLAALRLGHGENAEAAELAERALRLDPDSVSAWNNRLEALQRLGRPQEAIAAARQVLRLDPGQEGVAHRLALLLIDSGETAEAVECLKALLRQQPSHRQALQTLSVVQLQQGAFAEALETATTVLALAPDDPDLAYNQALAWIGLGRNDEAQTALERLLQRTPGHQPACQRLVGLLDQQGQRAQSLAVYEAALAADPSWEEGWFQLAVRRAEHDSDAARAAYEQLLALNPDHAWGLSNLAVLDLAAGELAAAAERLERAVSLQPTFVDAVFNLGVVLRKQGDTSRAESLYRRALELNGSYGKAACNLGSVLNERGAYAEARTWLELALRGQPDFGEAHFNLGVCLQQLQAPQAAEAHYRRSLELLPEFELGWLHLGNLLHGQGRHLQAIEAFDRLLELEPGSSQCRINRAIQYLRLRQPEQAVAQLQELVALEPQNALAWQQLGNAQLEARNYPEALAACDQALALDETLAVSHSNRGVALQHMERLDEAEQAYRQAIACDDSFADVHYNLGVLLKERGLFAEGAACYRRAIAVQPNYSNALSNLVYLLSFSQIESQQSILAATADWVQAFCVPKLPPFRQRPIPADRPLRLGVISAELGNHAVSYFLRSYLEHYDHSRTHVHLYPTILREEGKKLELFALVEGARELHALSDEEARQRILDDGIDILIDTTSHMRGNRLPLLAERCAPVQAHWIGFHGSTAVPAVDWFIGDEEVSPPAFADHFSERLWMLPRLWVSYCPPKDAPEPEASPDQEAAVVTLGSFNNLLKVGDACLDLYGQVLSAIPESRLLLKDVRCQDPFMRGRILERLAGWGIAPERIELVERVPGWREHMQLYNRLDVALDTTPLNSGTTGFDALFMGTPLVALRGDWMGGRLTASMLKALGRPEWVAETAEQFVQIVRQLTADRAALRRLRLELRDQVLASPLCDGPSMGRAMDDALAAMAQEHNRRLASAGLKAG